MSRTIDKTKIWAGVGAVTVFLCSIHEYYKTGCVTPHFYEPVCGQQAWIILGVYVLLGLLGIYLIISGLMVKRDEKKNNNKTKGG